jgi:hypothetical protein
VENLDFDRIERKVYDLAETSEEVLKIIKNKKGFKKKNNSGLFGKFKELVDKF